MDEKKLAFILWYGQISSNNVKVLGLGVHSVKKSFIYLLRRGQLFAVVLVISTCTHRSSRVRFPI
jgi:hypothetical protein